MRDEYSSSSPTATSFSSPSPSSFLLSSSRRRELVQRSSTTTSTSIVIGPTTLLVAPAPALTKAFIFSRLKSKLHPSPTCKRFIIFVLLFWFLTYAFFNWFADEREWSRVDRGILGLDADPLLMEFCPIKRLISPWDWILPARFLSFWKFPWCRNRVPFSQLKNQTLTVFGCLDGDVWFETDPNFHDPEHPGLRGDFMERIAFEINQTNRQRTFNYTHGRPVRINFSEIVRVFCSDGSEDYHLQNIRNEELTARVRGRRKAFEKEWPKLVQSEEGERNGGGTRKKLAPGAHPLNVIFLMYDSISRTHFIRSLPKAVRGLEKLGLDPRFKLFQFFRYQVLGVNSLPNITPMFRGQRWSPEQTAPFIWELYSRVGFGTLWMSGQCKDYFRAYWNATQSFTDIEQVWAYCHPNYAGREFNKVWNFRRLAQCMGSRFVHNHTISYLQQFLENYSEIPTLSFSLFMDAHEGSMGAITLVDEEIEHSLEWMASSGTLERSVLILLSDHGQYYGPYPENSEVGTQEHSLPFFFMILPSWFLESFPEARTSLVENQHRLVTAYDVYQTLAHLAVFPAKPNLTEFGMRDPWWANSLLDSVIPLNRTCRDAGISNFWCVCGKEFYANQIPQPP